MNQLGVWVNWVHAPIGYILTYFHLNVDDWVSTTIVWPDWVNRQIEYELIGYMAKLGVWTNHVLKPIGYVSQLGLSIDQLDAMWPVCTQ